MPLCLPQPACVSPAFVLPAIAADSPWVEVRSEHFTVITDAGEKNGRRVADRFEQMRTIFGLLFGRAKINQPVPLEIIAFRNSKELRQYSRSADTPANAVNGPEPVPQPQPPAPQTSPAAAKYLTGTLVSVDCSAPPVAVVSVLSGGKTWKMKVQDVERAIVIGADKLSCDWGKKKVGINYRPTGAAEGSIISLELE